MEVQYAEKLGVYEIMRVLSTGGACAREVPVDPYPPAYWTPCETYKTWAGDLTSKC